MVIEVSKEIDLRRIGIDRYSLKTGLNLRVSIELNKPSIILFLLIKIIVIKIVDSFEIFFFNHCCYACRYFNFYAIFFFFLIIASHMSVS